METIKQYLTSSLPQYSAMKEKNTARMKELEEQSQAMQKEYNQLAESNKFIDSLITEINDQFKQTEGESNVGSEENVQST
jgi:predicted nuclease with TOPRIM domain